MMGIEICLKIITTTGLPVAGYKAHKLSQPRELGKHH